MAEAPVVHINENSPEQIALRLMNQVMIAEKKKSDVTTRKYLLDTYAECLRAVKNPTSRKSK